MARINYSRTAIRDLEEIGDYIVQTLSNPKAALDTVGDIQGKIKKLADFPFMGAKLSYDTNYRHLVCEKYIAFYRVLDDDVFIDRILYGRRDYIKILFEIPSSDE